MSHLCLNKASTAELLLAITEIIFHAVHTGGREKRYNKSFVANITALLFSPVHFCHI